VNCCDEYGDCNQGRNCPVRVAKIGQRMKSADPLPPSIWRDQLKRLGYWMLMAVIGLIVWPLLAYLALRLS
jgi:hypothetical protein